MTSWLLAAALLAPASSQARGLETLGRDLAAAARRAGALRVAVRAFETPEGLSAGAGRSAAEAVLRGFIAIDASRAVERERLDAVLEERRLFLAGAVDGAEPPPLAAADAVISGSLTRRAGGWRAEARLVSVGAGVVLAASSADLDEEPERAASEREGGAFPPLAALRERADGLSGIATAEVLEDWLKRRDLPASRRAPAALALADASGGSDLALAEALHDPEPLVRLCAALGLGKARASWAEAALVRMLADDASWTARYGAAIALGRLGTRASANALSAALSREASWQVRQQAARSLGSSVPSGAAASALARALDDRDPGVRAAAGAVLAERSVRPEAAVDRARLREKDPSVRAAIDAALRSRG